MSDYHEKRVPLGGTLGDELKRLWREVERNKVVAGKGMKVSRTTSGTIVNPAASVDTVTTKAAGLFFYITLDAAANYNPAGTQVIAVEPGECNPIAAISQGAHVASFSRSNATHKWLPHPITLKECQDANAAQNSVIPIWDSPQDELTAPVFAGYSPDKGNFYWPNPEYWKDNQSSGGHRWRWVGNGMGNPNYLAQFVEMSPSLIVPKITLDATNYNPPRWLWRSETHTDCLIDLNNLNGGGWEWVAIV